MEKIKIKRALYIGRFQPFHLGHEFIMRKKLDLGIPLLVAIRDIEPDEKNPLTSEQSKKLIEKAFSVENVKVIIIPDIESVNWGRGVGYETNEIIPPTDICNISATQIREKIRLKDDSWKETVNEKIWEDIEQLLG